MEVKGDKKQLLLSDSAEGKKGGQKAQGKILIESENANNPRSETDKDKLRNELHQSEQKQEKQTISREPKKIFIPQKLEEIGFDNLKDFLTR